MLNVLKSFYRNFKKRRLIYGINIGGLTISLAVLVLIVSYIVEERSVDKHLPNIENMYRIREGAGSTIIPSRVYDKILDAAPEIESLCFMNSNGVLYEYDGNKEMAHSITADPHFIDIFSIEVLQGDSRDLLLDDNGVIITKAFANKVFGDKNPIGKEIEFDNHRKLVVNAVIPTPLKTSSLKYDVLFNLNQTFYQSMSTYDNERYILYSAVLLLNTSASSIVVDDKIKDLLKSYNGFNNNNLFLQQYQNIYFDTTSGYDGFNHANVNMLKLLSLIALVILTLAVLNYINLNTAFNNERIKEVCVRKTTGASNRAILYQFIGESYTTFAISIILSIGVASILSPVFKDLFNRQIVISEALSNPKVLMVIGIVFLVIGIVSGIIPAVIASRFTPIELLQKKVRAKSSVFRGAYSTIQIAVTIALVVCVLGINKQIKYVKTKDVGFDKELLLEVNIEGKAAGSVNEIKEQLLANPRIVSVSSSNALPFNTNSYGAGSFTIDTTSYSIDRLYSINTDTSFLSTLGLKLLHGRNFRPTDKNVCIINKHTFDHFQFKTVEGKNIWGQEVIGVVEDFHFKKMHEELGYLRLVYPQEWTKYLNIKIIGNDIHETISQIKSILNTFDPSMNFNPQFYDDWINLMYEKEEKQAKVIKIYSLFALFLSCLGLLGMAEFYSTKRTKEIGIRKVNGATITEILTMLNVSFVKWVAIAFVIACPIAYYAMNRWLENFAYKTELSWWIFALAGLSALLIALLTVSWQSWSAARRNPVEALRSE